jgi:predicted Ser/Thr protein kinase/tetratricopeptide (TPR) repeat protein
MADEPGGGRAEATEPEGSELKLAIGEHVGRYELLGMLGEGGMSYVYLAHDPELDRDVALKLMRVRVGREGARRLQREAQALAKLSHPNVVPVYDAGMVGGQAFVAMEYVPGKTLRTWLKGEHTWREILEVLMAAGEGLAAAHARGLVHRDFKPDNVLIGDDGRVRVLDFGLARLAGVLDGSIVPSSADSIPPSFSGPPSSGLSGLASPEAAITRADQLVGTPAYMAPEQVRREAVDARTDVYAYGVTLYEALFGSRPFAAPSEGAAGSNARTVTAQITDVGVRTPRPPPRGTPVPRHVQKIVARALEERPDDRWKSMGEMLAALRHDPYRVWRRAAGVALGVAAAGAVAVGFSRASNKEAICHGGAARQQTVWGKDAKEGVRAAFSGTGLPYAEDAANAVGRELDGYTGRLAQSSDDACAATRVRAEQSEPTMELRLSCYEARWREVDALVSLLRRADGETVKQALHAARSLSPLDDCSDVAALRASTPKPRDAETAAKVDAMELRLASVMATFSVGKSTEAATQGEDLADDARKVGYGPLVARTDFWRARAYADLSEGDKSVPAFRAAFSEALSSHEDRVLAEAAARLAQEYIYVRQYPEFEFWAGVAQAAIDRGTPDARLQSFLDHTRCVALWAVGKIATRLTCLERHAARVERTRPLDEWELTTLGLAAVDVGQFERGLDYARRGYEYALRQDGPMHPRTLEMRMYVCKAQTDSGDYDAALSECAETLRVMERVASDNHALLARNRLYMVDALAGEKRWDDARAELARAVAIGADAGDVEEATARIDAASGHAARALPHFREALAAQRELPPDHPDVIGAKYALGKALLDSGNLAEARTALDEALAAAARAELSPFSRAEMQFAAARALWATEPASRARAVDLARQAREVYATSAPKTRGFLDSRTAIDEWLAEVSR